MYRLASLNSWYDGMIFVGLSAAVEKARKGSQIGTQVDVMRDIDGKESQVVWTRDIGLMPCKLQK